ncbi:hypothetical protein FOA52_011703 [Chlamydomonas sp. UWO 241]|nr:hypothetical protein FOA52_011703 [Chlamydomonas sp. UWO 241]
MKSFLAVLVMAAIVSARELQATPAARTLAQLPPTVVQGDSAIGALSLFGGFKTVYRTGDASPTDCATCLPIGTITDVNGNAVMTATTIGNVTTMTPDVSNNPDFTSLHVTEGGNMFILAQFESPNPAAFYVVKVEQSEFDGHLTPVWFKPTNFSAYGGLWVPCAGSVTPWGSHAGSEEYEPDAFCWAKASNWSEYTSCDSQGGAATRQLLYFGLNASSPWAEIKAAYNPYNYGHGWEAAIISEEGDVAITKWFTLGRLAFEIWSVMPDKKTVYMTDDGTNCAFYKFVMDTPEDMSSGKIYAAKAHQLVGGHNGGDFNITWVLLGEGSQDELMAMMEDTILFSDIFETATYVMKDCLHPYRRRHHHQVRRMPPELHQLQLSTRTPARTRSTNSRGSTRASVPECLKLKEGMGMAAAFFETRRMAAYMGATTEWSKFEGLALSPDTGFMYTAMSQIRQGMEDMKYKGVPSFTYDMGGSNDVRLEYNPCGCVYRWTMDANYSATRMTAELCGTPVEIGTGENLGKCDIRGLAEPDNVAALAGHNIIIIGEDQGERVIDVMWQYDLSTKELTRILTTPYGSETTSPYWFADLGGFSYLGGAIQHPYGESDSDKADDPESSGTAGWFGVWSFKASDFATGKQLRFAGVPSTETMEAKYMHKAVTSAAGYTIDPEMPMYTVHG